MFYIHASASRLQDVYRLKRSEDLVEKIISLLILDISRSFKRENTLLRWLDSQEDLLLENQT